MIYAHHEKAILDIGVCKACRNHDRTLPSKRCKGCLKASIVHLMSVIAKQNDRLQAVARQQMECIEAMDRAGLLPPADVRKVLEEEP